MSKQALQFYSRTFIDGHHKHSIRGDSKTVNVLLVLKGKCTRLVAMQDSNGR